jgi:hypothetical protein
MLCLRMSKALRPWNSGLETYSFHYAPENVISWHGFHVISSPGPEALPLWFKKINGSYVPSVERSAQAREHCQEQASVWDRLEEASYTGEGLLP